MVPPLFPIDSVPWSLLEQDCYQKILCSQGARKVFASRALWPTGFFSTDLGAAYFSDFALTSRSDFFVLTTVRVLQNDPMIPVGGKVFARVAHAALKGRPFFPH